MPDTVFALDRATVARPGGPVVLADFSWTVREGETWAVTGPVGSGKSTLADALLGRLHLRGGDLHWPLLDRLRAAGREAKYVSDIARHVPFQENSRLFSYAGHYYQQRFEFGDADEPLSLDTFLRAGSPATADEVAAVAGRLGLADRLGQAFITLSNGQTRRARIARALLGHPELLVLDDPFLGVDAAGRDEIAAFLGRLVEDGLRLVLVCGEEAVPGWVTDQLTLSGQWTVDSGQTEAGKVAAPPAISTSPLPTAHCPLSTVVELRDVTVRHGGATLLDGVTWTVTAGERWAVVGPNGSGKTTLLSLLCGDHPQAFSNDVRLFGRRRGTGESIWDVKRRVGLTSPEFHLYFTGPLTAARAAATGFFDGVTDHPTTPEQDARVRELFADFGLTALAARPFRQLSTGEQKLVLLVRALVKRPRLLILDEPFQSFDAGTVARCRDWLDANLGADQALLFVTHHPPELPRTVTRALRLDRGRPSARPAPRARVSCPNPSPHPEPRMRALFVAALALLAAGPAAAQGKRPMTVEDLYAFRRVAAPQISPDGKLVVYQVATVSLEANKSTTALWVAATDGKTPPTALTDPKGKRDAAPRWSPDGKTVLFESNRSGSSQLWTVPAAGGEPKQLTDISTGAATGVWSPDGTHVAFVSSVFPEFSTLPFTESDAKNKAKDEEIEKSPVKAKVFTKLFYRHWDEYVGDKRQHLFVQRVAYLPHESPQRPEEAFKPRDVTPGDRDANPTSMTFSGDGDFTFTPDGKHLVFTAVPAKNEAWSTNYDLCRVSITNTKTEWETLTKDNPAADGQPKFSPDGKKLAWRAQEKPGAEADRWNILVAACAPDGRPTAKAVNYTPLARASVNEFVWTGEGKLLFTADTEGSVLPYASWDEPKGGVGTITLPRADTHRGSFGSLSAARTGAAWVATHAQMDRPAEVLVGTDRIEIAVPNLSRANDELLAKLDRPRPESVEVPIEGGKMQMWVLKPPGFDPAKKWPVAYLVHGGPQGAWEDGWSFRWNPSLWAAQGYVVVLPNPRGSTGFGQKFVDEISGDWGGKCYRDLVAGLDWVEKQPYVDKDRMASAGASFGGYMMNWFAVNDISKRFKCLVTHCSVWNFESMWGTTDELWFDEHEHGGLPWEVPGKYRAFSPHTRAGELAKHKTPMLVVHNDLDFRCPIGQGHELFSALQRQGVPSRFVNFPDEGHWVLKPKNGAYWHREVFGWLARYAPPGGRN